MRSIRPVQRVIDAFQALPGVGPKTAARLAYYLLFVPEHRILSFADSLTQLKKMTKLCGRCGNVDEESLCQICADSGRNNKLICVVEHPLDLLAIEKTGVFEGVYHVLGGAINPLEGIGPDELNLNSLLTRLKNEENDELIIATNPNMEGEATAMYISQRLADLGLNIKISRIGRGLPTGADLEYADPSTLQRALEGRKPL